MRAPVALTVALLSISPSMATPVTVNPAVREGLVALGISDTEWRSVDSTFLRRRIEEGVGIGVVRARAERNDPVALTILASAALKSAWGESGMDRAIALARRALEGGDLRATVVLAAAYSMRGDHATGRRALETLDAEAGYPLAATSLGIRAMAGTGEAVDPARARTLLERGVANGNNDAMVALGNLYDAGSGVVQDRIRALALYKRAAASDDPAGMLNVGRAYHYGLGTAINHRQAVIHYSRAATLGEPNAPARLRILTSEMEAARLAAARPKLTSGAASSVPASARAGHPPTAYDIRAAIMREGAIVSMGGMFVQNMNFATGETTLGFAGLGSKSVMTVSNPSCVSASKGAYRCNFRFANVITANLWGVTMNNGASAARPTTHLFQIEQGVWRSPTVRAERIAYARRNAAANAQRRASEQSARDSAKAFYCPGNGANPLDTKAFC